MRLQFLASIKTCPQTLDSNIEKGRLAISTEDLISYCEDLITILKDLINDNEDVRPRFEALISHPKT